jgi:DNA primase
VSTPLDWDEVTFALDPSRFTIMSVPDRVAEQGCPMRELLSQGPDIHAAVARLASLLPRGS